MEPNPTHDAEFAALALDLAQKGCALTGSHGYVLRCATFSQEREYRFTGKVDEGLQEIEEFGPRYAVVWMGGVRVFYKDKWLVHGPWVMELPQLVSTELDRIATVMLRRAERAQAEHSAAVSAEQAALQAKQLLDLEAVQRAWEAGQ